MVETFERVRNAAADIFQLRSRQLTPDSSPHTIAAWDSVAHLDLVMTLEQEFGLRFEPEEIEEMSSLGKISEVVERKTRRG